MFYIFKKKPKSNKINQVAPGFKTEADCLTFIKVWKDCVNTKYSNIDPNSELLYTEITVP